ncbi:MAG: EI24 domain-containing protein, partial [Myxococcota bacterium]
MNHHPPPAQATGVGGLLRGLATAMSGAGQALGNAAVRKAYVRLVAALLVTSVAIGAGLYYGLSYLVDMTSGLATVDVPVLGTVVDWLGSALTVVLKILAVIVAVLAAPLLALMIINQLFPMFAEAVFLAGLRPYDAALADELKKRPGLSFMTSLGVMIKVIVYFLALTILAALLTLVPVVGTVLGPVFQVWITAKTLAWELFDPYFDKCEMRFSAQRAYVDRRSKAMT